MTQPEHAWMVRAGDDNELADGDTPLATTDDEDRLPFFEDVEARAYEALEPEYKAQVPLHKVWVPVE